MDITIVKLPKDLKPHHLQGRAVVVFDVLRATTTIVTAIANGAKEVRVFESLDAARLAAGEFDGPKLLAGESRCLPPPGFDLGNSPGDFTAEHVKDKTIFLSTTNGTRAIVAAQDATRLFAAACVNVTAMASYLRRLNLDVTLLCSGTDGARAIEDEMGAGMVEQSLRYFFDHCDCSSQYEQEFRDTDGGRNILKAGLEKDIAFAAQADCFDTVVEITGLPPVARKRDGC
jgi:2-phosphosulfolactate phosphatase